MKIYPALLFRLLYKFSIVRYWCNADVISVHSSFMHSSCGRQEQHASSTKEHQGDHSNSLSAARNGLANTSKLGVEAIIASTQLSNEGGVGIIKKSPLSGQVVILLRATNMINVAIILNLLIQADEVSHGG